MYKIITNDFDRNIQSPLDTTYLYLTEAREGCIYQATEYILKFEGSRYLNKLFWDKDYIRKGYAMVKKDTALSTKITIYYKEPNGILYSGKLRKVISFETVKVEKDILHLFEDNPTTDFEYNVEFAKVIKELKEKKAPVDPIESNVKLA